MNSTIQSLRQAAQGPPQLHEGVWHQHYVLPSDFIGFAGHFADNPVLPAVMQLELALVFLGAVLGRTCQLNSVKNAKFTRVIKPGETIKVICPSPIDPVRIDPAKSVKVVLMVGDETAASLTLYLSIIINEA